MPPKKKGAGFNSKHLSCVTEASLQWKQFQQSDVMVLNTLKGRVAVFLKPGLKCVNDSFLQSAGCRTLSVSRSKGGARRWADGLSVFQMTHCLRG